MLQTNKLYCMDAIEFMKQVDDNIVDLILTDLPYGITACEWDTIIPLDKLWIQFKRILKDKGVVILTASQPFTTDLINSNREWFRYEMIWNKLCISNFASVKYQPLRQHENIIVFYNKNGTYNPQPYKKNTVGYFNYEKSGTNEVYGIKSVAGNNVDNEYGYPRSIIEIRRPMNFDKDGLLHPTQKPIKLFRYLIKTYTNKGDLVLDCCVGSGTTALACKQTDRRFLCNDNNLNYIEISNQRLKQTNLNAFSDTTETLNESPSLNTDLTDFSTQKSQIEATPQLR